MKKLYHAQQGNKSLTYDIKNTASAVLNWFPLRCVSVCNPAILENIPRFSLICTGNTNKGVPRVTDIAPINKIGEPELPTRSYSMFSIHEDKLTRARGGRIWQSSFHRIFLVMARSLSKVISSSMIFSNLCEYGRDGE